MNHRPLNQPPLWTAEEASAATDGTAHGIWTAEGVSIDSRTTEPGDLFVALQGPHFDGHDFVAAALAQGAAAAMIHRRPPGLAKDAPVLEVADTMAGLVSLGRFARLRYHGITTAITGSVGKTGTKEALFIALDGQGQRHASGGSFNNHWGVPLSLARMPQHTEFGVFELGMNHPGEIDPLSHLVKPDIAVITTVEAVHIEHFRGVEEIADAKAEIFAGMSPRGVAVLNRDNPYFPRLVAHARTHGLSRIWSFGEHADADARLVDCWLHASCSAVRAIVQGEAVDYSLPIPGRHWVQNSLAVLLAVKALGADLSQAAGNLAKLQPMKGRGRRETVGLPATSGGGFFELIDESYNASPIAVQAACEVLGAALPRDGGRRIAVLGDMLELGDDAGALHRAAAKPLIGNGIDLVFACGPWMAELYAELPAAMRGAHAEDSAALAATVAEAVRAGDVVMVKGSLGSRMAVVVDALRAPEQRLPNAGTGTAADRTRREAARC